MRSIFPACNARAETSISVSMCYNIHMSEMYFDGQQDNEKVQFIFRKHMMTTAKGILFLIVMIGLGIIPLFIWPGQPIAFWVFCAATLIGLLGCGYRYMLWYYSYCIVTDGRIRQNIQRGLFKHNVEDLYLDKVHSISYNVPGLVGGIFGYGTLTVQTQAGELNIKRIAHPAKVYNRIQEIMGESHHA